MARAKRNLLRIVYSQSRIVLARELAIAVQDLVRVDLVCLMIVLEMKC